MAQFDLANGVRGYSGLSVSGIQYYLGDDTGITHRWTDDDVTNGQTYYYAVTAYDSGSEAFNFYPSENAITVSRTLLRGGTILPPNVVQVRPNARVPGLRRRDRQRGGPGLGHRHGHGHGRRVQLRRGPGGPLPRRVPGAGRQRPRARTYSLVDLDTGEAVFEGGTDLEGAGTGPIGLGVQPVVTTLARVQVDPDASGYTAGPVGRRAGGRLPEPAPRRTSAGRATPRTWC